VAYETLVEVTVEIVSVLTVEAGRDLDVAGFQALCTVWDAVLTAVDYTFT